MDVTVDLNGNLVLLPDGMQGSPGLDEETAAILGDLTEHHSLELGFDNVPKEEEDETTHEVSRTAFQCFVCGTGNSYGDHVMIVGDHNENKLGWIRVIGSHNKTYQFQDIHGDCNEFDSAVGVTVHGSTNKGTARAKWAYVAGDKNTIDAENSYTAGYRITNRAKGSFAVGQNYELPDAAENERAFAIGGGKIEGTKLTGEVSFIHRTHRKELNPMFDGSNLETGYNGTEANPKDKNGERKYLAETGYSTEYRGQMKPTTQSIAISGSQTVTLDPTMYSRVMLTGSGTVTFDLEDYAEDGDRIEVVMDTSAVTPVFPAGWMMSGADVTQNAGVHVIEIEKVMTAVYCRTRI